MDKVRDVHYVLCSGYNAAAASVAARRSSEVVKIGESESGVAT